MVNFMHFFVVTCNVLLQFILLVWFYGVIVMANGRKIVPEEKAPLNRKHRREVPLALLQQEQVGLNRNSMRNRENQ